MVYKWLLGVGPRAEPPRIKLCQVPPGISHLLSYITSGICSLIKSYLECPSQALVEMLCMETPFWSLWFQNGGRKPIETFATEFRLKQREFISRGTKEH